jgi:hypothetical protein
MQAHAHTHARARAHTHTHTHTRIQHLSLFDFSHMCVPVVTHSHRFPDQLRLSVTCMAETTSYSRHVQQIRSAAVVEIHSICATDVSVTADSVSVDSVRVDNVCVDSVSVDSVSLDSVSTVLV